MNNFTSLSTTENVKTTYIDSTNSNAQYKKVINDKSNKNKITLMKIFNKYNIKKWKENQTTSRSDKYNQKHLSIPLCQITNQFIYSFIPANNINKNMQQKLTS